MSEDELIDVIDEQENVIKTIHKSEVRKENALRRGASIFVFDGQGRILIHQRAKEKKTQPNKWDITVGGWVLAGETPEQAAYRETEEEIGAENIHLTLLLKYFFKDKSEYNNLTYLYKGIYNDKITLQKDEVQAFEWVNLKDLKEIMRRRSFTPESQFLLENYSKCILGGVIM